MNTQIVRSRLKEVLNVDSINSTQADFMATHVPFRKITVTNDLTGTQNTEIISEEEIFNKYFNDSSIYNNHQLIVVDGSSGSGKSHFIRWISAKLEAQEEQRDVILMIRRSDNTLKGTIKQFLDIDEVKNIKNKDVYERLVKANQNISEQRFKYEIYHKFLVEIADDEETILSSSDRKNFRELLSSSEFEERMLMAGGPIERIYSKIVDNASENNEDIVALFEASDFTLDYEFNMKLKENASKKAVKMANKLLPETDGSFVDDECNPKILSDYMNSKVESVIKACAGIEPGDFQQIFKEIRKELYKQGKNLVLLIEDITSFTGINQDLLDALIVEHTGINEVDHMCRIVSVIGTTTEYFSEFRDNYIHRISTKITIEDGSIGNYMDDLIQFVAKYLNALSITTEDVNAWYNNGAIASEYPVHIDSDHDKWEYYNFNGKKLSLYPFNKRAIVNLYNRLENKTPRYILRKIIEPAVDNVLQDNQHFPKFVKMKREERLKFGFDADERISTIIKNIQIDDKEEYKERVYAIIGFWGDGTLNTNKVSIGSVNTYIFKEFKLEKFAENILGVSITEDDFSNLDDGMEQETTIEPIIVDSPKVEKKETNKAFDDFARILLDWHYEGKSFIKAYPVRDEICKFIFASIEWQREGVSLLAVQMVEKSSYTLISIERQDRAIDKGLVVLEDSEDTYQLLLAFGKWLYIGKQSWNFDGSASSIRFVTGWLEKNKFKFIDVVKGYDEKEKIPTYIRYSIVSEIYRGILNGDYRVNRISDLKPEVLLKDKVETAKKEIIGHSSEWIELHDNILYANGKAEENRELIHRHYNLIQGNIKNATRKIVKYTALENDFKELKKSGFSVDINELVDDKIKARNISKDYLKKILSRIDKVIKAEVEEAKMLYKEVLKYLGFSDGVEIEIEDIKDLLNEIIDFYKDVELNGINIVSRVTEVKKIKENSNNIVKALAILNSDIEQKSPLEILMMYSQNPMGIVKKFIGLLSSVDEDREKVYLLMQNEKNVLTRSGNWSDGVDPRFETERAAFDKLVQMMEG